MKLASTRRARFLAVIAAAMASAFPVAASEVTFRQDVMAVISKAGCNLGGCHGNGQGKGGLKLSLRGQDPDLDWLAIAREQGGRRVNGIEPEQSLILLKATASVAHEGGQRFATGSPEYAVMRDWLRAGAGDTGITAPRVVRLEVTPPERVVLEPEETVRLKATAVLADGTRRDVTRLAVYEPSNQTVKVTADGEVIREKAGESTVLVRFLDQQVAVPLAFVPARPGFVWRVPTPGNFIDELVFRKLRTLQMNPAAFCDDVTFLRRVFLDLCGIVPSAEEARAFLADSTADKRSRLVDALLKREEFADFWALKWADLLKIEERQLDANGMQVFHGWIRESIAKNKPLDQFARELIAARGSTYQNPPANWWRANRDPVTRAEQTARVFLGTQLNCAQCHNHPFERWTQDDYYDWTSLFARLDYKIVENKKRDKSDTREFKGDQLVILKAKASVLNPRTGEPATPRFLGGEPARATKDRDELLALADWLPRSPMFARMQVNRIWFHLLGRGLVDPVDDFRASNPPSNPPLLEALVREFTGHGYDLRHMIRTITSSRVYQLSSDPRTSGSDDLVTDLATAEANFACAPTTRLTAEQIVDSASTALAAPLEIEGFPGAKRVAQVPEGRKHYHPIKTDLDRFALAFGKPPRLLASECERTNEPTLVQAFQLISGPVIDTLLTRRDTRLQRWTESTQPPREIVEEMFWATLSRPPVAAEVARFEKHIAGAADPRRALEDAAWALLNSKEFLFRR